MKDDLINAKELLAAKKFTCVICKGDEVYTSVLRGVKPLVAWYESGSSFYGFSAADKVVGKATAFIYVLLGVKSVYAQVISKSALNVLHNNGIEAEYATLTENIINRSGDGICPFEEAVLEVNECGIAYDAIKYTMKKLNITL